MAINHLGVVEDHAFEQSYFQQVLRHEYDEGRIRANYETRDELYAYMQAFVRKHAHKLVLFGYQAIGGSEQRIVYDKHNELSAEELEARCNNVREQMRNGSHFNRRNVRHLFIDGNGTFNSATVDTDAG